MFDSKKFIESTLQLSKEIEDNYTARLIRNARAKSIDDNVIADLLDVSVEELDTLALSDENYPA